jgi:aryl-alcohol dehydrogenase-like predicted oxidoreductase
MEKVNIENIDTGISRIGLGTWAIGGWMWGGTDEKQSIDTIHAALEKGINLIDTAPVYGFGLSEEIVGKALSNNGKRDEVIISTKVGVGWRNGKVFRDSKKETILKEIDDSLKRLQTDYIDIYHIHWPDPLVPIEETAETMKSIFEQKKIRAIAVSNYSVEQMERFRKVAPLHVCQVPYNMFERDIEPELLPYCKENNITVLAYGVLCRGLLTGKMKKDTQFSGDDLRKTDPKFKEPRYDQYLEAVDKLKKLSNNYSKNMAQYAARWALDQGADIVLWGARNPHQLDGIDEIWDWSLHEHERIVANNIINTTVSDPVGPEFLAPPAKNKL